MKHGISINRYLSSTSVSRIVLIILLLLATMVGCGDDQEEAARQIKESGICNPEIGIGCDATLKVVASGVTTQNSYAWAALMENDSLVAFSPARPILVGSFEDYPLDIDVAGLSLSSNKRYEIMMFQTTDSVNIGSPTLREVSGGPIDWSPTAAEVAYIAGSTKDNSTSKVASSGDGACLMTGHPVVLKIVPGDFNGDYDLVVLPCSTSIDTIPLYYEFGGNIPNAAAVSKYGYVLPLHKTGLWDNHYIKVEDTADVTRTDSIAVVIVYPTDVGYRLGNSNNWIDTLICEFADSIGFVPQLLKSQVRQESNFDSEAYRYEPNYDYLYISIGAGNQYQLTNTPFAWYRLAVPSENGHSALSLGNLLDYEDEVRGMNFYSWVIDDDSNGFLSAWEYINNNSSNWNCPTQCPPTSVDFTAQTAISSSYGLMQIMWPTALLSYVYWNGGNGGDPHLLTGSEFNLRLGTRILRHRFIQQEWSGNLDSYTQAVDSTLRVYNGSIDYITAVRQWLNDYQIVIDQ